MPSLCFWIGPLLFGGRPLRGVLGPSVDKAGRRFPLMIAQTAGLAPVLDPDQGFYDAALTALQGLQAASAFDPREAAQQLAAHLTPASPPVETPAWPSFWALNANLSPGDLFADLVAADHANAAASRSYWWFGGSQGLPSGMLACQGLPGPGDLGWLILGWRGVSAPPPQQQEAT
jgi:type VI secretion system protein ImpM